MAIATVCTACCHQLDGAASDLIPSPVDVSPPSVAAPVAPARAKDELPATNLLTQWPAGPTDGMGNGLSLPNQRSAAFNPLRVAPAPPPSRYLAAERRQQACFRAAELADVAEV